MRRILGLGMHIGLVSIVAGILYLVLVFAYPLTDIFFFGMMLYLVLLIVSAGTLFAAFHIGLQWNRDLSKPVRKRKPRTVAVKKTRYMTKSIKKQIESNRWNGFRSN